MNRETRKRSTEHGSMATFFIHVFRELRIFCETTDTVQNSLLRPAEVTSLAQKTTAAAADAPNMLNP